MAESKRWTKLITRRLAVQNAIAWNDAFQKMFKVFGIGVHDNLTYFDGKKTEYYLDAREERKLFIGLNKLVENQRQIHVLPKNARKFLGKKSEEIHRLLARVKNKIKDSELLAIYRKIFHHLGEYYPWMWIVFLINEPLAEAVRSGLMKRFRNEKTAERLLLAFSRPFELNDAMKQRLELLRIADRSTGKNKQEIAQSLDRHVIRFRHIPMFDVDHGPWDRKHFEEELSKIANARKEIVNIKKSEVERKRAFKEGLAQLRLRKKNRLYRLIHTLSAMAVLRDYRDSLRQKLNLALRGLYFEIGRRADLDVPEILLFSDREIESYLQGKISRERIKELAHEREKAFLLIQTGHRVRIFSGKAAVMKVEKIRKESQPEADVPLKGIAGSTGRAKGRAVIVHTNLDLQKVEKGDVLVAPITRQDFVPVMRKCVAFVTDEGGVTCHTAIIAREFGLPCVVGTKNATSRFRDGDLLEVDCAHGTVRKVGRT